MLYTKSSEFASPTLENGDELEFVVGSDTYNGKVMTTPVGSFVCFPQMSNGVVFDALGLDKYGFVHGAQGYEYDEYGIGDWPYSRTLEDLTKVVKALFERCEKYNAQNPALPIPVGTQIEFVVGDETYIGECERTSWSSRWPDKYVMNFFGKRNDVVFSVLGLSVQDVCTELGIPYDQDTTYCGWPFLDQKDMKSLVDALKTKCAYRKKDSVLDIHPDLEGHRELAVDVPMVWTHEYPAIPGYYWVRYIGNNDTRSVCCISSWDAIRERQVMYLGHFVSFEFLEFCWVPCPSELGSEVTVIRKVKAFRKIGVEAVAEVPVTNTITIPEGWRKLGLNDVIERGDKYDVRDTWQSVCSSIGQTVDYALGPEATVIRKVEEPEVVTVPNPPSFDGWRLLGPDEVIEKGDLFISKDTFHAGWWGSTLSNWCVCRSSIGKTMGEALLHYYVMRPGPSVDLFHIEGWVRLGENEVLQTCDRFNSLQEFLDEGEHDPMSSNWCSVRTTVGELVGDQFALDTWVVYRQVPVMGEKITTQTPIFELTGYRNLKVGEVVEEGDRYTYYITNTIDTCPQVTTGRPVITPHFTDVGTTLTKEMLDKGRVFRKVEKAPKTYTVGEVVTLFDGTKAVVIRPAKL